MFPLIANVVRKVLVSVLKCQRKTRRNRKSFTILQLCFQQANVLAVLLAYFRHFGSRFPLKLYVFLFVCRVMSWTNEHNLILCKETIFVNPFSANKKSVQRSGLWQQIADNLNATDKPRFLVGLHFVSNISSFMLIKWGLGRVRGRRTGVERRARISVSVCESRKAQHFL